VADGLTAEPNLRIKRTTVKALEVRAGTGASTFDPLDQGDGTWIGVSDTLRLGTTLPANPSATARAVGTRLNVGPLPDRST
jgi:hypothetical protein